VLVLSLLALLAWLYLLSARGGFWRADQVLPAAQAPKTYPPVAVLIPARNEAETIERVVAAHQRSDYPGELRLFVSDDGSEDGTGELAARAQGRRRVEVLRVPPLEEGWSGKLHALDHGLGRAKEEMPEAGWYLLTDADIEAAPSLLTKLVAYGERCDLSVVSVMARLDASGFWGRLLVPAFIYFFQKLYPFPLVNRAGSDVAAAAGGVVLVRPEALEAIGGLASMRGALIDDCTLAARVKKTGRKIGLYLSSDFAEATSLRPNDSYQAMERMVARSAYTQLRCSPLLLTATLLGLALLYLVPPLAFLGLPFHGDGSVALLGLLAWALMAFSYRPTLRRYGLGGRRMLTLPLAALFYGWFTWLSAWRCWQGRGGQWKGRSYASAE
jgi:hopene-associated glycosyltransferase HpnB